MNELAVIDQMNPVDVFKANGGIDALIEKIESEVKSFVPDISTEDGRNHIRSVAFKIARAKTELDKAGKELKSEWKKKCDGIDSDRRRAWDRLEALQLETRKPLTDWEDAIKLHVAERNSRLAEMADLLKSLPIDADSAWIQGSIDKLNQLNQFDWQEFTDRADREYKELSAQFKDRMDKRIVYENEQAELTRLRQAEELRKQKEREAKIAAEAAELAKREAEAQAKRLADAEAERVEKERKRIQKEKEDAEARAKKAEEDRKSAEKKAKDDLIEAQSKHDAALEKAKMDAEAERVRQEKIRVETAQKEKERQDKEAADREADIEHRKKINNETLAALMGINSAITQEIGTEIIKSIARGKITNVKIFY